MAQRIITATALGSVGVEVNTENYGGYHFADFFARRDPATGPGWYVYGRNSEKYGTKADGTGIYVMLCARPSVKARRHRHYNCLVRRGWATKGEAEAVARFLFLAA